MTGLHGDESVLTPLGSGKTLALTLRRLGGRADNIPDNVPAVVIGDARVHTNHPCVVRATYGGWSGGAVSREETFRLAEDSLFPPAALFAAALAVSECFAHVANTDISAGYRSTGLSLYSPQSDWRTANEPDDIYLPNR